MFQKTKSYKFFILVNLKNRVYAKNNDKISVTWSFLDPIKNCVSVKSLYVEAVYLEVLLYSNINPPTPQVTVSCIPNSLTNIIMRWHNKYYHFFTHIPHWKNALCPTVKCWSPLILCFSDPNFRFGNKIRGANP